MLGCRALPLAAALLGAAAPLHAGYAPVPEQDLGKDLTITLRTGLSHDSNIFGGARNEIGSAIWSVAPRISFSGSLTDTTFLAAGYGATLDYFDQRPGEHLLPSHDLSLRAAHAFTKTTTLDVVESFTVSRNPESLLAGIPLSPDQSFTRNQLDGRFNTPVNEKVGVTAKARSVLFRYRDATLGRALDRTENILGLTGDYAVLPELRLVGEFRHQDVYYRKEGETKNKRSDFVLTGVDYEVARKLSLSGRVGSEWRSRAAERSTQAPYLELSGKYDYAPQSFLAGGVGYTLEETSDTLRFTDTRVTRCFASMQHGLTALIVASGSASFEPSRLQGRRGQADVAETTWRTGAALSYLPSKHWTISANWDYDHVNSDEAARRLRRQRVGLNASYAF